MAFSAPASVAAGTNFTATATVTNNGPSAATNAVMTVPVPAGSSLISVSTPLGACSSGGIVTCSFGGIASGQSITVTLVFEALTQGSSTISATVAAGENDPMTGNNTASATTSITGASVAPLPSLASIAPNVVQAGSSGFTLTLAGNGFTENSTVEWGTTALATSYVSATQLTAEVPASLVTSMGWVPVMVANPSPGGGVSSSLPFSIFGIVNLYANDMVFDPYTRLLYASVNSAATQVAGNTIVTIDPTTGTLGTPVSVGTQPGKMALTDDGNYLYVDQGTNAVGRFNMTTQNLDFSFPVSGPSGSTPALRNIVTLPGSENMVAVDLGATLGAALYEVYPASQTATALTNSSGNSATGGPTGSSPQFLNASTLFTLNTSNSLQPWTVTSTGLVNTSGYSEYYNLNSFLSLIDYSAYKICNGFGYADAGGVANLSVTPPQSIGVFASVNYVDEIGEPDTSQGISYFATALDVISNSHAAVSIRSFNQQSFLGIQSIDPLFTEGNGSPDTLTMLELLRCGPDELALLRSDGTIMLFQGGFVVPGLLSQNPAAALTAISTLTHGSGNSIVTLTGTGFLPGVEVMWNGSYRTTTLVNATEVTVDLPASDLLNAGTHRSPRSTPVHLLRTP